MGDLVSAQKERLAARRAAKAARFAHLANLSVSDIRTDRCWISGTDAFDAAVSGDLDAAINVMRPWVGFHATHVRKGFAETYYWSRVGLAHVWVEWGGDWASTEQVALRLVAYQELNEREIDAALAPEPKGFMAELADGWMPDWVTVPT